MDFESTLQRPQTSFSLHIHLNSLTHLVRYITLILQIFGALCLAQGHLDMCRRKLGSLQTSRLIANLLYQQRHSWPTCRFWVEEQNATAILIYFHREQHYNTPSSNTYYKKKWETAISNEIGGQAHMNFLHSALKKVLFHTTYDRLCSADCSSVLFCTLLRGRWSHRGTKPGHGGSGDPRGSGEGGPRGARPVPFSGWCKDFGPCEGDVKASLPFHGALIWPFHGVKPKEIHVHDLCGASLHSGTGRRKSEREERGAAYWEWKGQDCVHTGHTTLEL